MKEKISYLVFSVLMLFVLLITGCSTGLGDFQQVEEVEYSLSTILDDYPALRNLIYSLSLNEVSKGSVALIYEDEEAYRQTKDDLELLLMDRKRPAQKAIKLVRNIIERLVNQDTLDREDEPTDYAEGFYGFVDLVHEYDFSIRDDLLQVMILANRYSMEEHTPEVMRETAQDAIDNLTDPVDKDIATRGLEDTIRLVSKLCIQSDQPMWLNSGGTLITNHNEITDYNQMLDDGADYIGLGHATRGLNSLLMAVMDIARDSDVRNTLKNLLTDASDMTAMGIDAGAGEKEPWEILRDMMVEDYTFFHHDANNVLAGDSRYTSSATMSHGETYQQVYGRNDDDYFSNSEARNIANFSNALGLGMFLRSDRPESLISSVDPKLKVTDENYEDDEKHKHYFPVKLFENLKNIGYDPEEQHLEESIYDLIRHDTFGRDRRGYNPSADWTNGDNPWPVSYLEQFLFLSAMSQNSGWFDGGDTSEDTPLGGALESDHSDDHGHGDYAGGITLNDSLFAMGGKNVDAAGIVAGTYTLAFVDGRDNTVNSDQRDAIHRNSKKLFSVDDYWGGQGNGSNNSPYKIGYNQNYFAQRFMSGAGPGDIGIPSGGNPTGATMAKNEFQPFAADGIGDVNTSRFLLYWMARACWNGEGPYYYKPAAPETVIFTHYDPDSGEDKEDTWEIYDRPGGRVYAFKNTRTGRYLYPADGSDPEDPFTDGFGDDNEGSMVFADYAIDEEDNPWNAPINCGDGTDGKLAQVNGRKQRHNRYKSIWYTDYYMISMDSQQALGLNDNQTFVAPNNEDGIRSIHEWDYDQGGSIYTGMGHPTVRAFEAGRFKFNEMIEESNPDRACDSHIEAMYRNYQWLVAEKKMAIVVPMNLYLDIFLVTWGADEQGALFQILEGNGIAGLTGARYFAGNNVWAYQGGTERNSTKPGDFRVRFLYQGTPQNGTLKYDMVVDSLGGGTSQPAIITHNVPGVYRFAFPRVDKEENDIGIIGSGKSNFTATESDAVWNRRNGLLPVVLSALGTLMDYQNRDFADAGNRATTLMRMKKFSEGLMSNIMSRFYYKKRNNGGDNFANHTWLPRVNGSGSGSHHQYALRRSDGSGVPRTGDAWLGWAQRRYFQPIAMRTPLNLLYDSDPNDATKFCDGLLPMALEYDVTQARGAANAPRTRVVTNALKLVLGLTDEKYDDAKSVEEFKADADTAGVDYDSTFKDWGTRRRLFYGLEQFSSMTRATKGPLLSIWTEDSALPFHLTFEDWFFVDGTGGSTDGGVTSYTGFDNARPEDVILEEGGELANDSLARSIEKNQDDGWEDFQRNQKMMSALLSTKSDHGSDYYVLDKVLSILFDKVLAQEESPNSDQVSGLLHTFGSLVSTWNSDPDGDPETEDGAWEFHDDEFKEILFEHLLRVSEITLGEYPELTDALDLFAAQENRIAYSKLAGQINLENADGTIRYVLNTLDWDGEEFSSGDILKDIDRFIKDKYSLLTDYDTVFWPDVVQLMNDSSREVILAKYGFDPEEFFGDDFQYNGQIEDYFGE